MPKATIHAKVYNRIFGLSGPGPIFTCSKLTVSEVRDGAGDFRAEFPATDGMLDLIGLKRTYLEFEVGGKFFFLGLVERLVTNMNREGQQTLLVMGRDVLAALAENTVGDLAFEFAFDAPAQIVAAASVPNQTFILSTEGEAYTESPYSKVFSGESALGALTKLAADIGEHFRAPKTRELTVVWMGTATPIAPVRLVAGGGPRLHENTDVAIIEHIERDQNGERMANRVYAFGAGVGDARLTMAAATITLPAGYTLNAAQNFVAFDDTQGLPYVLMAVQKSFNHIGVEGGLTLTITVTANAAAGATLLNTEFIGMAIPAGTLLDLNGGGINFVELSAPVSVGGNVLNVVATTFAVVVNDTFIYTPVDALEGAANQLALAAYHHLARISDPDRMVAYKMTVRGLPDTVTVGMKIPVLSQAPGFAIDDDLIILEIRRTITKEGRTPAELTVVPVDWFDVSDAASIAATMEEFRVSQAQGQPVAYGDISDPPPNGATAFTGLTDTPASFAGHGGKVVAVKVAEDGVEFVVVGSDVGATINAATADTPLDADKLGFWDAVDSVLKSVTWANIKATLKTYFDTLYVSNGGFVFTVPQTGTGVVGQGAAGRVAVWTGTNTISDELLSKSGGGLLTLDADAAYTLTVPATGTASLDGHAHNDVGAQISAAATDDTIVDADLWGYVTGGVLVKTAWSNIKAALTTLFDTLYGRLTAANTWTGFNTFTYEAVKIDSATHAQFLLDGAAGSSRAFVGLTNGVSRWTFSVADAAAESGSNAGSDMGLTRFDDAGVFLDSAWRMQRNNGFMGVGSNVTPIGQLHVDQASTTAAASVLVLDQGDVDQPFINFITTIGTGNATEAKGAKTLTTTHFLKVNIVGVGVRYLQIGTIA